MTVTSDVSRFLQHHPDFDVESFDFLSQDAVDGLAQAAGASDGVVQLLKSTQRLLRLGADHAVASLLRQRGFDSAHSIAAVSEDFWVDANQDAFPEGSQEARDLHRRAQTVKGQTSHLWAAVHGAVRSTTARSTASHTADSKLVEFFSGLPDYEALFGPQNYCSCEHCRSVFGPAAYFVDLMRIIDRYVTQPNKIAADQTLESRRKDLFSLRLDCANTNTVVPTLQIVNTVLEERARTELGVADVFKRLATQIYPLQLPANIALLEVRQYLASADILLAAVFRAFERPRFSAPVKSHTGKSFTLELHAPIENLVGAVVSINDSSGASQQRVVQSWDAVTATGVVDRDWVGEPAFQACTLDLDAAFVARETLSLSTEQASIVARTDTSASYLKSAYGLGDAQPLSLLSQASEFRRHTGMSRESLPEFLLQNLGSDEIAAGMAHGLFINAPLADKQYIEVRTDDKGQQTVTNLNEQTLDRIHRFFRLSHWTGIAAPDLDWALSSLGMRNISSDTLIGLAGAMQVRQSLGQAPWDITCAFWHDLKTTTSHAASGPTGSLFDRVFNRPDLLRGARPYHPLYAANPLYLDVPSTLVADGTETVSAGFGRMRLAAALGLSDEDLTAVTALLFDAGTTVVLDVPTLTIFFRAATLMKLLRLTADGLRRLLTQQSIQARDPLPASRLDALLTASRALSAAGLSPAAVDAIVHGDASGVPILQKPALPYSGMKALWALAMPMLLTPVSFSGDLLDIQESTRTYAVVASTRPDLLLQVGAAYKAVMGLGSGRGMALVLLRVGVDELAFLSDFLDSSQIAAVVQTINRTYDGQLSFLTEQAADLVGTTSQMLLAAVSFFDRVLQGRRAWLAQFLTPAEHASHAWTQIESGAQVLRRLLFACEKLALEPVELQAITAMPEAFGLHDLAQPGVAGIQALVAYKGLLIQLNCPVEEFLVYLALAPDPVEGEQVKRLALSDLTGWVPEQITEVARHVGHGAALYSTVPGILRMSVAFSVLSGINADMRFVNDILVLQNLPVQGTGEAAWNTWRSTASSVAALVSTRFTEQAWPAIDAVAVSALNEARRDMLEGVVLWKIRDRFADIDNSARLYAFLLVDVKTGGCASTSLVVEGLSALQLYLQRCRLNLEVGVDKLSIPDAWWDWMMNYRVWEANRKIFLYPENYLVPSVRRNKTTVFKALEESLLQANVDDGAVARAYRDYLSGLEPITTLAFVDAYRCQRQEDEASGTQTLFLVARTRDEPYTYYQTARTGEGVWTEWKKINVTIDSPHISPVYAFGRLFLFWVHLRRVSTSEIRAPEGATVAVSANSASYQATISYSFRDVDGDSWVAPQTLAEDVVSFVTPADTPFNEESGHGLFDMDALYWHKVSVVHVPAEAIVDSDRPSEKIVVLYGPFLENNLVVGGEALKVPAPPDPGLAVQNPNLHSFLFAVRRSALQVNQALASKRRGVLPLSSARVINTDLNLNCLISSSEVPLLLQNRADGVPASLTPRLDLGLGALFTAGSLNPVETNYYGDLVSAVTGARRPQRVRDEAFEALAITQETAARIELNLRGFSIINESGMVGPAFSRNTDLSFADGATRALLVEILLDLKARDKAFQESLLLTPAVSALESADVVQALKDHFVVDDNDLVAPAFASTTDLSYLFAQSPVEQRGNLVSRVRYRLFELVGDPELLGRVDRENGRVMMVKNQPNWFIFSNGAEAFLVHPETEDLPAIDKTLKVRDVPSPRKVFPDSFITSDISSNWSKQVYADLLGNHIIDNDGIVSSNFSARSDLSFLFPGKPTATRLTLIAEVRGILLDLPTLSSLSYYFESQNVLIGERSFISLYIDAPQSKQAWEALVANGLISNGTISSRFSESTSLDFLFPDAAPDVRKMRIAEVRTLLERFYAATWQVTVRDFKYRFTRLTTGSMPTLMNRFFAGGLDALLALASQQAPILPVLAFADYLPSERTIGPEQPDGAQVDFDGPYGTYFWELFFLAPQLVAITLSSDNRFAESMQWFHRIFDPTQRPQAALTAQSLETPNIDETDAAAAFMLLREKGIVTAQGSVAPGFGPHTELDFLFPDVEDPGVRHRLIGEVQSILLNTRLATPASQFWRFAPFRNHTLQSLVSILTDRAQIAVYNNEPFDPYAIARLRIGAFEKAIFMQYLDNLIAWGDSLFAKPTRESLSAATLTYMYASELLGERPVLVGPCPTTPAPTFSEIRARYAGGEIPQFLIEMEHLLPGDQRLVAADLSSLAFNDIDAVFGVPENDQLLGYWDRVEDRLYKLRNCLDLQGMPLHLPLFDAPINPLELARAAASSAGGGLAFMQRSEGVVSPYRFNTLIGQAQSLASSVSMLGSSLASALQSRDGEKLSRLRAAQELTLADLATTSRNLEIQQIQASIDALKATLKSTQKRIDYYDKLAKEFVSPGEVISLLSATVALSFKLSASGLNTASSIAYTIPQLGSPFAMTFGGIQLGNSLLGAATTASQWGDIADFMSQTSGTMAGYVRRLLEWKFESGQAGVEKEAVLAQISEASLRLAAAQQELKINQATIAHAKANADFLLSKFDTMELYGWMAGRLSALYYQTWRLALDASLAAQAAYGFELNRNDSFINLEYWDSSHMGLLAGEALGQSLNQMQQAFYNNNVRKLEISKFFSLARQNPAELRRLIATGECTLSLLESMFDFDFPGQYCRRIAAVTLSIYFTEDAVVPGVSGTLVQIRNDILTSDSGEGVNFLLNGGKEVPASVRRNLMSNQLIALSGTEEQSGMFNMDFGFNERFLHFEGTGAVSEWILSLPFPTNQFDFAKITDVELNVRYTALQGSEEFRNEVTELLSGPKWAGRIVLNLATAFEEEWKTFMEDHSDPAFQTLSFGLSRERLAPHLSDLLLDSVDVQLSVSGTNLPVSSSFFTISISGADKPVVLEDSQAHLPFVPALEDFVGAWKVIVDLESMKKSPQLKALLSGDGFLNPDAFRDVTLLLTYRGAAFQAPAKAVETMAPSGPERSL